MTAEPAPADADTIDSARDLVVAGMRGGFALRAAVMLAQLATTVLLVRLLGPVDMGVLAVAISISAILALLFGLQLNVQAGRSPEPSMAAEFWPWAWLAGIGGASVTLALAGILTGRFAEEGEALAYYAPFVLLSPVVSFLTGMAGAARATRHALILSEAPQALRFLYVAVVAVVAARLTPPLVGIADTAVLTTALVYGFLVLKGRAGLRWRLLPSARRRIVSATPALLIAALGGLVLSRIDVLMVSAFLGDAPAGLYHVAVRVGEAPFNLYVASMLMFLPAISRVADGADLRAVHSDSVRVVSWLLTPALVAVAVYGDVLVRVLFGSAFEASGILYLLVAAGIYAQVIVGPTGHILVSRQRHRALVALALSLIITDVAMNALLIPILGLSGAALATAMTYGGVNATALGLCRRHLGGWVSRRDAVWAVIQVAIYGAIFGAARVAWGGDTTGMIVAAGLSAVALLAMTRADSSVRFFSGLAGRSIIRRPERRARS